MKAFALIAILAGCGRIGFDGLTASDGALGDGVSDGTTDGTSDGATGGAATITYVGTTTSELDLATYTFSGVAIGPPAANRIVVVSAFLGGAALTPITSITVNGSSVALVGAMMDTINGGSVAIGYKTIPTGTTADITVTSGGAGRAAIVVYNVTANNETPNEYTGGVNPNVNTSPFVYNADFRVDEAVVANVSHGAGNASWTWGGTWLNYTERIDSLWTEQGGYSSASATADTAGLRSIEATPSVASPKLYNVAIWR